MLAPVSPRMVRPAAWSFLHVARTALRPRLSSAPALFCPQSASLSTTATRLATFNQVLRKCRKPQPPRKKTSPALEERPNMQGVCLRVMITKPKKPNSGERKTCRIRLSSGKHVSAYIPGEGHNVQQHSVVMVRGGRAQDCPGVRYKCIRGAKDLGGVPNKLTSRSKYGTKKPKAAAAAS